MDFALGSLTKTCKCGEIEGDDATAQRVAGVGRSKSQPRVIRRNVGPVMNLDWETAAGVSVGLH